MFWLIKRKRTVDENIGPSVRLGEFDEAEGRLLSGERSTAGTFVSQTRRGAPSTSAYKATHAHRQLGAKRVPHERDDDSPLLRVCATASG